MNMKKIMAGVVGSAMAVSMMAVAANAATGYLDISANWGNDAATAANSFAWTADAWSGANVLAPEGSGLTGENAADYALTITVEIDGAAARDMWLNEFGYEEEKLFTDATVAIFGGSSPFATGTGKMILKDSGDGTPESVYSINAKASAVNIAEDETGWYTQIQVGHFSNIIKSVTIEYSVEDAAPAEDEGEAAPAEDEGEAAPAEDEGEAAPAEDTGSTSAPTTDKQNANTGVEGVAVVAGLAIIAAGAVVVAKKRG